MSDEQFDAALDLLRRLDPANVAANLNTLCRHNQDLAEDLLTSVDQPLSVREDPTSHKPFLCCDYNRDGDSYRSPHSNTYVPPIDDAPTPSKDLRSLEVILNDAVETYRELYYEGGLSSCYLWEPEAGKLAGVVLIKKELGRSVWDSVHVFEATEGRGEASYELTSTVLLSISSKLSSKGKLAVSGNLTRQISREMPLSKPKDHVVNVGTLVEEMESRMRSLLHEVYFGKTTDIVGDLRTVQNQKEIREEEARRASLAAAERKGL